MEQRNQKIAHSSVGAPEQAAETESDYRSDIISYYDTNTFYNLRKYGKLTKVLSAGKENAVPGWKLVEILGLKDLRDLTQLVERERRDGSPICASTGAEKGYYLADGPEELEDYLRSLNRRVKNINRTVVHLEDTLSNMTGQQRIGGD